MTLTLARRAPFVMQLPGAIHAYVPASKVRDYLLSSTHPDGRSKARFFATIGFRQASWPSLLRVLEALAREGRAEVATATRFGQKYLVRGTIEGRAGRKAVVVTVWIILTGEDFPRFVTAYPEEAPHEPRH